MGEPVKILDLAESMIRLHGLKPYLLEGTDQKDAARGDIAIQIVGLSKGEKLYEELLLGNDPMGTAHPRILTATEIAIPLAELDMIMDRLWRACQSFDLERIRDIFLYAPLEYRPNDDVVHDVAWTALQKSVPAAQRRLEVVNSRF
jgi:FlaA1/EpsC-like NDP-sugar epimerase